MRNIALFLLVLLGLGIAPVEAQTVPHSREQVSLSFAPLVKQVSPAVVNIYTKRVVQQRISPLFADPLFSQFFGNMVPPGYSRERLENSLGSGVIVRADGLIVTSNHVIQGANEIRVVLSDRREFDATIVTTDEHSDLAVLRVDAKGESLPFIELRDSDDAEIGDLVLAIGNPFGVGRTVTSGIISAITHAAVGSSDLDYFIQTDAAINPGNSGGALVTMDGKLVGINAAIYSRDGGNLGIGFAVPSNMVRVVLSAVEGGKKNIVRPWLGVDGQGLTAELAASMSIDKPSGFLVNSIHPASPALKAGLAIGDVIMTVNGRVVEDPESFRYRVATLPVGSIVEFGVWRKGQMQTIRVNLIAPPEDMPRNKTVVSGQNPLAGAVIENLSPAVMEELGLRGLSNGVIITSMKSDAVAENIGLQIGDIIDAINGQKIKTVKDVTAAVQHPARGWRITILRGDNQITLMVGG